MTHASQADLMEDLLAVQCSRILLDPLLAISIILIEEAYEKSFIRGPCRILRSLLPGSFVCSKLFLVRRFGDFQFRQDGEFALKFFPCVVQFSWMPACRAAFMGKKWIVGGVCRVRSQR